MGQGERIVCRCEEVTESEVAAAMSMGAATPRELKLRTRVGMGSCQGRVCRPLVHRLLGPVLGPDDMTVRPPVRLTTVEDILQGEMDEAKGDVR